MNLDNVGIIYFIGIGGIGMSATAALAKQAGFEVIGSEQQSLYDPAKAVLEKEEITYFVPYDAQHIDEHPADVYVASAGEGMENPEIAALSTKNIPVYSFADLLYELAKDRIRIVVTGTHGKSTTAGWLGHVLGRLDDSSFMTGAVLQEYETNFRHGDGHYFVFEGDEYKSTFEDPTPKFHHYKADMVVLTNLEFDHPDMYQSLEELRGEFANLLENLPDDGVCVYNADDPNLAGLAYETRARTFSFSVHNPSDFQASEFSEQDGTMTIRVKNALDPENVRLEMYHTKLPGEINVKNALAAILTLRALGFQPEAIDMYLSTYKGVKRRFEIIGEKDGVTVVDDYAHHPTAVRETLAAARSRYFKPTSLPSGHLSSTGENKKERLWAVFEPHTFSRTRATLAELATSFADADEVLLAPIYPARENAKTADITSEEVIAEIKKHQPHARLVQDKADALSILKSEAKPGDVIIVMAVGSFNRLSYDFVGSN